MRSTKIARSGSQKTKLIVRAQAACLQQHDATTPITTVAADAMSTTKGPTRKSVWRSTTEKQPMLPGKYKKFLTNKTAATSLIPQYVA